jgi:hypothetical protein
MNDEKLDLEESDCGLIDVLAWQMPEGTEKNHLNPQLE